MRAIRLAAFGSVLVWPERDEGHYGDRVLPTGGTFDLRTRRAGAISGSGTGRARDIPDGLRVRQGATVDGALFEPLTGTWRELPDVPHPEYAQSTWAAGGRTILRYGGTRDLHPDLRQEVPVNEAYVLDPGRG